MSDISVFTVEERLIAAVWVHDRIRNDMTMEDIRSAFTVIKGQVSGIRYETIDQLKHAIIAAFASVSRNSLQKMAQRTWRRMELCKNNEGQHTDPLDH